MDYRRILKDAVTAVVEEFEAGRFELGTEADLRSWLFRACATGLQNEGHPVPLPVHAEKPFGWGNWRPDLQLGPRPDEAVELKLQTVRGDSIFLKASGGAHSVQSDLDKICDYARQGANGHFVFVEVDDGTLGDYYWPRATPEVGIPESDWTTGSRLAWVHYVVPASAGVSAKNGPITWSGVCER